MAIITYNRFPTDTPLYAKPLLLELPDDIVINGVAHDKLTLAPKFLRFFEYDVYQQNTISTSKYWYGKLFGGYYSSSMTIDNGCGQVAMAVRDDSDDDVIYHTTCFGYYTSTGTHPQVQNRLFKIDNKTLNPALEYKVSGNNDAFWIIDQDNDSLYIMSHTQPGSTSPWGFNYFSKLNKATMTMGTPKLTVENGIGGLIKVTNNMIYSFGGYDKNLPNSQFGGHRLMAYDKGNSAMAYMIEDTDGSFATDKLQCSVFPSEVFAGSPNYYYYPRQTNGGFNIIRSSFSDNTAVAFVSPCIMDYGDTSFAAVQVKHSFNSLNVHAKCFRVQSEGDNYICLSIVETRDFTVTTGGFSNDPLSENIYIFKIDPTNPDRLIYKNKFTMGDDKFRAIIPMEDTNNLLMLVNEYGGKIIRFSPVNEQFVTIEALEVPPRCIGFDDLGRTWISDDQNRLHLFTPQIPTYISCETENEVYDYVGLDIPTNLKLHATNFMNQFVAIPIKIVLTGTNIVFMDGTREKIFNSLDTGNLIIPVKIIGPGYTRIVASAEV